MWENFFKHIDIKPENANILDGNAADLDKECKLFEEKITAAGGIQLFVGGGYLLRVCVSNACTFLFFFSFGA